MIMDLDKRRRQVLEGGVLLLEHLEVHRPIVLDVPHAGRQYPAEFEFDCDKRSLLKTEDRFCDALYHPLFSMARYVVIAKVPRTYVDLNRECGVGAVRKLSVDGQSIRRENLSERDYTKRFRYHSLYVNTLRTCVERTVKLHGYCIYINLHTFMGTRAPSDNRHYEGEASHAYVGNRNGASASSELTSLLCSTLNRHGIQSVENDVFPGAFLLDMARSVSSRVEAIQLEVRRNLYLRDDLTLDRAGLSRSREKLVDSFNDFFERVEKQYAGNIGE